MKEEWRELDGYEKSYIVSNCGNVMSIERVVRQTSRKGVEYTRIMKSKLLSVNENPGGYSQVTLSKEGNIKTLMIHRLVGTAFLENNRNLPEINHKDGNKKNNRLDNLEWVTSSDNHNHAYKTGLRPTGSEHHFAKLKRNRKGHCLAAPAFKKSKKQVEALCPVEIEIV